MAKKRILRAIRKKIERKLSFLTPILVFMVYLLIKTILLTVRKKYHNEEPDANKGHINLTWHNRVTTICFFFSKAYCRNMTVIASRARGGRAIAGLIKMIGINNIAGSTGKKGMKKDKGGATSFRKLLRILNSGGTIGLTPDGPRGPRYEIQKGVFMLYKLSKREVFVTSVNYKNYWFVNTWDRIQIPKPFTKAEFFSKKVPLQLDMSYEQMEKEILSVMNQLTVDKPSDK